MTIQGLINKLKKQQEGIEFTLEVLHQEVRAESVASARKAIVKSLKGKKKSKIAKKGFKYKGTHWTQRPENAAKLKGMTKKSHAARRNANRKNKR